MRITFLIHICLLLLASSAGGQSIDARRPDVASVPVETDMLPGLPSLDRVIEAALDRAPQVLVEVANVARKEHELRRVGRRWMDQVSLGATAQFGVYGNEVVSQASLSRTVGLGIQLSLFDLFGRSSERGVFREELEMARHREDQVRQELEVIVAARYRHLELAGRLVQIHSEALQATKSHVKIAEFGFSEGDVPVSELARVTEIYAKAQADFESARSEYLRTYGELETLVGRPLSTLR